MGVDMMCSGEPLDGEGSNPSVQSRRLRSAFNELEFDEWIDNLDDGDIDYFYNLMMDGEMDDVMDAFRYDMEYDDYGEYNDYDGYLDQLDDYEAYDGDYYEMDNGKTDEGGDTGSNAVGSESQLTEDDVGDKTKLKVLKQEKVELFTKKVKDPCNLNQECRGIYDDEKKKKKKPFLKGECDNGHCILKCNDDEIDCKTYDGLKKKY